MKKTACLLFTAALMLSCGGGKDYSYEASADYDYIAAPEADQIVLEELTPAEPQSNEAIPVQAESKKIIKTGNMTVEVRDLAASKVRIDSLVSRSGGYYALENYNDYGYRSYTLQVRIPVRSYEDFIASVEKGPGKVTQKEIKAQDVTEQFVDLETRLANKRSYLERYRGLLKQARNIEEILEVETHIRQLEEEIESVEGRLRYLGDQVSYSSLRLVLQQDTPVVKEKMEFWTKLKDALHTGWNILVHIFLFVILIWPLWLIGGVVVVWIIWRRRKRKQDNTIWKD